MKDITLPTHERKPPAIDVAELAYEMRSSSSRFRALVCDYRQRGVTAAEIVEAMAASPLVIDPVGPER